MNQPTLIEQLRACANSRPGIFDPHWIDEAKRLMKWAADTIEAANAALAEQK